MQKLLFSIKLEHLTRGVFEVEAIHPNQFSEQELLHLAAHVEQFSTHPIAIVSEKCL